MTRRENWIRAARFQRPDWIPVEIGIPPQFLFEYGRNAVWDVVKRHPLAFPGVGRDDLRRESIELDPWERADTIHEDSRHVKWRTTTDGMTGVAIEHPLHSFDDIDLYPESVPDPARQDGWKEIDWDEYLTRIEWGRETGLMLGAGASLRHGHTLLTLEYICGFTNLAVAMAEDDPRLDRLIDAVTGFNLAIVNRILAYRPDRVGYPEDLGSQQSTLISPQMFRRFIKPAYRKIMQPAVEQGAVVHMHSDGWLLSILDDLCECGVNIVNVQDRVNGIHELRDAIDRRMAVDLDIDRQCISVFGTRAEISEWIEECVGVLGYPDGGLVLRFEARPPLTPDTLDAVAEAFESISGVQGRPSRFVP